jgi:peptidoglycan/LPS O-acetylase OafA/YrhL
MNRYDSFNGLRGFAAIGILLMHYRANINPAIATSLKESSLLLYGKVVPFFTNFVYMFFIVSAFSMCCGYFNRFRMMRIDEKAYSTFDTNQFYSRRYVRAWPFFALLVLIDCVMKPSASEFYQAFADLTLAFNFLPNPDISVIGVGWFLGLVFAFYMVFPWFAFLLQNKKRAWFAMLVAIAFHVICVRYFLTSEFCIQSQIDVPRHNFVFSFPFFMAGGLLFLYRQNIFKLFEKTSSRVMLLIISLGATCLHFTPLAPRPFGESVLWAGVIFVLWVAYAITGGITVKQFKLLDNKVTKFLGDLSMEIYLCHMVMFRVVEKLHIDHFIHNAQLLYWTYSILGLTLTISFSFVVTKYVFPKCSTVINKYFSLNVK